MCGLGSFLLGRGIRGSGVDRSGGSGLLAFLFALLFFGAKEGLESGAESFIGLA